jgi:hypothetical protein
MSWFSSPSAGFPLVFLVFPDVSTVALARARISEWRQAMEIEAFIDTLNSEQQQVAFDLLWRRLAADSRKLESPAWHEDVLAYRTANPSTEPNMSVAEAKIAVKRIVDERRSSQ